MRPVEDVLTQQVVDQMTQAAQETFASVPPKTAVPLLFAQLQAQWVVIAELAQLMSVGVGLGRLLNARQWWQGQEPIHANLADPEHIAVLNKRERGDQPV